MWDYLLVKMRDEGFHYCFLHYSNWEDIEDEEFHRLRALYIDSAKRLEEYIKQRYNEEISC